jgi:hypothetical protein
MQSLCILGIARTRDFDGPEAALAFVQHTPARADQVQPVWPACVCALNAVVKNHRPRPET